MNGTAYLPQTIFFAFAIAFCVGVVTFLLSACRVVRRMWK